MYAVWLLNYVLPCSTGGIATRHEIFTGREHGGADKRIAMALTWGCTVWAHEHVDRDHSGKRIGKPKAVRCVFLGYDESRSSFRLGADHGRSVI